PGCLKNSTHGFVAGRLELTRVASEGLAFTRSEWPMSVAVRPQGERQRCPGPSDASERRGEPFLLLCGKAPPPRQGVLCLMILIAWTRLGRLALEPS